MMSFLVDDLLDFAQLNAGKFRKVIKAFDLKESIKEVINIQLDKASMAGIKLSAIFKPQSSDKIISLFNKKKKSKPHKNQNESDFSSDEEEDD